MTTTSEAQQHVDDTPPGRPSSIPFWLPLSMLTVGVGVFGVRTSTPITELDTWWHLRLGDEFRSGWSLSGPGQLTPFATQDWVPTQWLLEIVGSFLVAWFGTVAISWLVGMGVVALGLTLFAACRQQASALPAMVATLAAMGGTTATLAPRPQVASFVFLAIFVGAWWRTAEDTRPRWWLVPLGWIWACTHGMWFVGVALGAGVVLGLALDRRASPSALLRLSLVPLLSVVAAALTPVGPALLLAPFRVGDISKYIAEWAPPNFRHPAAALTALLLVVVVMALARHRRPVSWVSVLVLVQALGWTLLSARTVTLGAILVAPLLASVMSGWLHEVRDHTALRRDLRFAGGIGLVLALVVTASMFVKPPTRSPVGDDIDAALATAPDSSVILNEYELGGWLEWRHRHLVPVVDSLTEAFGPEYIGTFIDTLAVKPSWEQTVAEWEPAYALLYEETPLTLELRDQQNWRVVARDETSTGRPLVLLRAPD